MWGGGLGVFGIGPKRVALLCRPARRFGDIKLRGPVSLSHPEALHTARCCCCCCCRPMPANANPYFQLTEEEAIEMTKAEDDP